MPIMPQNSLNSRGGTTIMDRTTMTRNDAKVVSEAIRKQLGYLSRLRERMRAVGFPDDDRLLKKVDAAYDAMHRLSVELHYMSCDGVGRAEKGEE